MDLFANGIYNYKEYEECEDQDSIVQKKTMS